MPLWRLLEDQACWAGVRAAWERWLGDALPCVERWFRPRDELATSLPCDTGRWLRVIEHGEDDVVAIDDETDAAVAITLEHRVVYELDGDKFMRDVACAFGLDGEPELLARRAWRLGQFVPISGEHFPVFMAIGSGREELQAMVGLVAARSAGPFVLMMPTDRWLREDVRSLLRDRESVCVVLQAAMRLDADGLETTRPLADLVRPFVKTHVPAAAGIGPTPRFPTPAGAEWRDVSIRFTDGHTVTVSVCGVTKRCTYEDMGMGDKRTRQPTKQWDLLRAFADERGQLGWESSAATRANQKRRERLAKEHLQPYFGIHSDPFEYDEDLKGWRARFTIEPD